MAATARFDLTGDAGTGSLENGRVVSGDGTISRMNWVPAAEQTRGYTISFAVTHVGWRSLAIEFTPSRSGTVTLTLMGPWEEASRGSIYREEVLWDEVKAEGAKLAGGGFESRSGNPSLPWQSGGGTIASSNNRCSRSCRIALCAKLAQPDSLHPGRVDRRAPGHDQPFRPGRAAGRFPRDAADRRAIVPGTPGGQAISPRREPRQ